MYDAGGSSSGGFPGAPGAGYPGGFAHGGFHSQESAEAIFRQAFGSSMNEVLSQLFGGQASLQVGMEVQVLADEAAVLRACRQSGIGSTNDALRRRGLGRSGRILKVDPRDQSVKIQIPRVGDVWFGAQAVRQMARSRGRAGADPFFGGFGGGFGGLGGFGGAAGGGAVTMRQEMVTLPDGRRVLRVTRSMRNPDGSLHEEVMETPLQ